MCGIVGVFEYGRGVGSVSEELVVRMRETIRHRGPDGEGAYVAPDRRLGFGIRRLAIVDIAGGTQPMFGPGGTCLIFNGEIYNYPELRRSLERDGVRFRTNCDTEVILHLYARYGEGCVDRLTGMFAFALWDDHRERLFFARDPIGEKPFYWADRGGVFVFASEIKALLEHPAVPREVNEEALGPYLANLVTPGPETLYRGIHKLPAGCTGRCDREGVEISRYSSARGPREFRDASTEEASARVRELLDASVQARLMSDVPVGVLLSGGLDSTTIVALLNEHGISLDTFTVGFPGYEGYDERAEARWAAAHFGTNHHEIALAETDALGMLSSLVHHQDEPLADPVCLPLFAVCGLARDNDVKVVLAGEGADELFWGYSGYLSTLEKWRGYRTMLALPRLVRRGIASLADPVRVPHRREQLDGIASGRVRPIHMPLGLTGHQRRQLLLSGDSSTGWVPRSSDGEDPLTTLAFDTQEYEFGVRLPELLLMRIDRFSMANSVEARVPFLDPVLTEYVYHLPLDLKIRSGVTKFVLKQAVADIVPERVTARPKQGFNAPTSEWFAAGHGRLLRGLMGQDALRRYFDMDYLAAVLGSVDPRSWESGVTLWPILNFALWHKHWIEGESFDDAIDMAAAPERVAAD